MEGRLQILLDGDGRTEAERALLARLMAEVTSLPDPPSEYFPEFARLRETFLSAARRQDGERLEESFLELYCHLHMNEAPYTAAERRRVDETGGYWCHAGGLSPILKAGPWIGPETVSADLGAGNGLQGLLLQLLYPHAMTIQVEISREMVAIGRRLQSWLGIPEDRVEWVVDDVSNVFLDGVDFLYLYRPVRPEGEGRRFYENLAARLEASPKRVVIFSIADCLRSFLSERFEVFYGDGHLTCLKGPGSPRLDVTSG